MDSFKPADYTEEKIYKYLIDPSSPTRVLDRISMAAQYAQTTPAVAGRVYWTLVRAGVFDSEGKARPRVAKR